MPKTPDYFAGKTLIVTGAASGIGRATTMIFAREGANVVCADINADGARETASAVNAKGGQALSLAVDVTSRSQVDDMVRRAIDAFGGVQFQFNSAAPRCGGQNSSRSMTTCSTALSHLIPRAYCTACRRCCRTCSATAPA